MLVCFSLSLNSFPKEMVLMKRHAKDIMWIKLSQNYTHIKTYNFSTLQHGHNK